MRWRVPRAATQRGPFVQFTWRRLTIGGNWFHPGSNEQVLVGSMGVTF